MRVERIPHGRGRYAAWAVSFGFWITPVFAADPALSISEAWTPAAAQGGDTPVYMVIHNTGPANALIRVRCAAANFSELSTIDRGEGFPSRRPVKEISISGGTATTLGPDGSSVMLLQTTRALAPGDVFNCAMRFQDNAQQTVNITVR